MSGTQEDPAPEAAPLPKKPPRPLWQQIAYNMMPLILLVVAASVVMPMVQNMMNPEPRRLTPLRGVMPPPNAAPPRSPATRQADAPDAAADVAGPRPDAALIAAYGEGTVGLAARDARRLAALGLDVARCRTRDAAWLARLRDAAGAEIASRYNSYDGKPEDTVLLRQFTAAQYAAAFSAGAASPVPIACDDLPAVPEFRAADALARATRPGQGQ